MLTKASSFRVGLFLLIGIVVGLTAVIWLGASRMFEETKAYVTYFDESVSGLSTDASVKYRGVTVGRVDGISVAPDGKLIEVSMRIDPKIQITRDVRAQLKEVGITGIRFIELAQLDPTSSSQPEPLAIDFPTPAPEIPSKPSTLHQFFQGLDDVFSRLNQLDLEGLVAGINNMVAALNSLASDPRWGTLITNLETMTGDLGATISELKRIVGDPRVENSLKNADALLREAREATGEIRAIVKKLEVEKRFANSMNKLDRLTDSGTALIQGVDQKTEVLQRRLERITRDLETTGENLKTFSKNLERRPSGLLFDRPVPERNW